MPRLTGNRLPKYGKHKASGQAVVKVDGRDIYLGPWNSKASKLEYDRVVSEWLANGRSLPSAKELTIVEIAARYMKWAVGYYVKNGRPTGTTEGIKVAIRVLCDSYGRTNAADFGPLALIALQTKMIGLGMSRRYINDNVDRIRRLFKWAASQELIPITTHQSLTTVTGLRRGRTAAREKEPVLPVADSVIEATLPHLKPIVADMVRLQRLTGCRPDEICSLRPCDVDRSSDVWSYRPQSHKTEHHARERVIFIGPKGQEILAPYLSRPSDIYCFVPAESEKTRNAWRRANRRSPMTPSQFARQSRSRSHGSAGVRYSTDSFRRAIHRACDQADLAARGRSAEKVDAVRLVPNWSPNQLRHAAATEIRRRFGLEAAQVTLGHSNADVTQIYAERDQLKAVQVMRLLG